MVAKRKGAYMRSGIEPLSKAELIQQRLGYMGMKAASQVPYLTKGRGPRYRFKTGGIRKANPCKTGIED